MQLSSFRVTQMPQNGNSPVQGQTHVVVTSMLEAWETVQEMHVLLAAIQIQIQIQIRNQIRNQIHRNQKMNLNLNLNLN